MRSLLFSAAKLDLWPVDFDLATATLSSLPGGAAEFLRGIKVPVVRIVPVPEPGTPNPAVPSLNNARKFAALFSILFPKQYVSPALRLRSRLRGAYTATDKSAVSFGNQCAVIKANFKGVANSNRGIVMFTGLKPEEQPLFAAVYIDHDLPSLPNVRAAQQQRAGTAAGSQPAPQTQVPQPTQAPQQQMSQQQQAALLQQMLNRQQQQGGPMNLNFPQNLNLNPAMVQAQQAQAQQQRYLAQQRLAAQVIHQQQQQQLANNSSGTGNVLNALGFIPGGPGPGAGAGTGGAFGQSAGAESTALPPTFSANADMNAQLMALRQQHLQRLGSQAQSQQQPQQQMTNFLNLGGGGGGFDMFNGLMGNK